MGNYEELKTAVASVIKTNGNQEITGAILQNALLSIISSVGANSIFAGIATPDTNPGTPDQNVFYLAATDGVYSNFNGITLSSEVVIFTNKNGNWDKIDTELATLSQQKELEVKINSITNIYSQKFNVLSNTDLIFDGTKIEKSESSYKGYILQITRNIKEIAFDKAVHNVIGLLEYPKIGLIHNINYGNNITKLAIDYTDVKYILITDTNFDFNAECFYNNIIYSGTINVTNSYPLSDGTYYTLTTAINAIEKAYITLGLQLIFYDGTSWRNYQFYANDIVYFKNTSYWRNIPFFPTLDGVIFKNGQDYNFGGNAKGIPILDVNTITNGGYDRIFLYAVYKTETAVLVQFTDENDNILCQFYKTEDVSAYSGIQTVECTPIYDSGVQIKVKLNWDLASDEISDAIMGKLEIIQKKDELLDIEERVTSIETILDGKNTIFFEKKTSSRMAILIPITYDYMGIMVILDDGYKDVFSYYRIFLCEDEDFTNLTLFVDNCKFEEYYDIRVSGNYKYVYIYNNDNNNNGFSGYVNIINKNALEQRIDRLEQLIKCKDEIIVSLGDSITEFKYGMKGYVEYLQELTDGNVIRGGIGGTRLAERATPTLTPTSTTEAYAALDIVNIVKAWTLGDWSLVDAANQYLINNASNDNTIIIDNLKNNPITSVNVVTILGGTNDLTGGSILGTNNSILPNEVCGAINLIVKMILEANPNIRIFIFTPIVRYIGSISDENWSDVWVNSKGYTLPQLCEKISECAKLLHIPICDMYWGLGWNRYNFSNYFIESDVTHPYKGFSSIAKKMIGFINSNRNF